MTGVYKISVVLMLLGLMAEYESSPPYYTHFCSCKHHHPQTLLCRANFIAKVKILKKMELLDLPDDRFPWGVSVYETVDGKKEFIRDKIYVKIRKTYKRTSGKTNKKLKLLVFPVVEFEYGCQPAEFVSNVGETFVIGGTETDDGVKIELCEDFHEKWKYLTPVHKKLLRSGKYINNCKCEICYEASIFYESTYYDSYRAAYNFANTTCEKANNTCIYDLNEETGRNPVKHSSDSFDFSGCYQGNAFCQYNEKKGECGWKFHRKTDDKECEDKLNT